MIRNRKGTAPHRSGCNDGMTGCGDLPVAMGAAFIDATPGQRSKNQIRTLPTDLLHQAFLGKLLRPNN